MCREDQQDLAEAIKCFPDRSPPDARNSYFLPGAIKTITKHHEYYMGRSKYRVTLRAESSALIAKLVYLEVKTRNKVGRRKIRTYFLSRNNCATEKKTNVTNGCLRIYTSHTQYHFIQSYAISYNRCLL